jgi:hypothetical protein
MIISARVSYDADLLLPVCVAKFRALPDAEAKQIALSKADTWRRRDEFPNACYTLLLAPKSAELK